MDLQFSNGTNGSEMRPNEQPTFKPGPDLDPHDKTFGGVWHDSISLESPLFLILVTAVVIAVLVVCILTLRHWWRKTKAAFKYKPQAKSSKVKDVSINLLKARGRVGESPCLLYPVTVKQREVKQAFSYDFLGKKLDSYFGTCDTWVYASPIYDCMEHGAEGLFELQFRMWATGTKLLLCHNPLSNVDEPCWEFIEDADFVIDEENKLYKVTVTSLCQYCIAAYGEFKEDLVILPFVRRDPNDWKIITCMLYFAREPASIKELVDKIREVNRPIISGEGAVFCPPIQKITVMNSKLVVECTVPVNCLHVHLPWTEKILEVMQFKDLQEHVTGCHLEFEMTLAQEPRPNELPRFQLSFYSCNHKETLLGPIRISCPPCLPLNHLEPISGTPLCYVVATVYQCHPGMFENLWKEIAQSHIWGHVPYDIEIKMRNPLGDKFGMQMLHYLAHLRRNVTVEKLAAAVSYTEYGFLKDVIKKGTIEAGYSFDDKLYEELLDEEKRLGGYRAPSMSETAQSGSSIGPIPSSPNQSIAHAASDSTEFQRRQTLLPSHPVPIFQPLLTEMRNCPTSLPTDILLPTMPVNRQFHYQVSFTTSGEDLNRF